MSLISSFIWVNDRKNWTMRWGLKGARTNIISAIISKIYRGTLVVLKLSNKSYPHGWSGVLGFETSGRTKNRFKVSTLQFAVKRVGTEPQRSCRTDPSPSDLPAAGIDQFYRDSTVLPLNWIKIQPCRYSFKNLRWAMVQKTDRNMSWFQENWICEIRSKDI